MGVRFENNRLRWWLAVLSVSAGLLAADFFTGPFILFPLTFVLPVSLAGWFLGRWPAVVIAVALTSLRFVLVLGWGVPEFSLTIATINAGIRLVVFVGLGLLVDKLARQHRELARRVRILEGLLPICMFCKKIRQPDGKWESVEVYVGTRTEARFSHGICESCARKHYPELFGTGARTQN